MVTKYQVEYNLGLDLGVQAGWTPEDEKFDTEGAAIMFMDTLRLLDPTTGYRIVPIEED